MRINYESMTNEYLFPTPHQGDRLCPQQLRG